MAAGSQPGAAAFHGRQRPVGTNAATALLSADDCNRWPKTAARKAAANSLLVNGGRSVMAVTDVTLRGPMIDDVCAPPADCRGIDGRFAA
ncbi:hypothetical protein IscW_ISCW022336 [Ixodes scapularis]|uniref:Uncharacterized protein n=1 Tax=Ixodes scapularis TaxID=6945 RepID=B7QBE7_IXOSC|nr:hypothetical protein IscW_ISCW022336 [Ixodes scapularis]|eukprot:XP_002412873.1 hypothetical protein IscW_ISCW022336 [Ixodes scapularis]